MYQPARYHAAVSSPGPGARRRARRRPLPALLALVALAALLGAGCAPGPRPDVVLVVIDTLRADRLGAYGYPKPTSPAIDAVAREGVVFRSAVSSSSWTKPAIASLFTALYPSEHGIVWQHREGDRRIRSQVVAPGLATLAERFRQGGYATVGVVHQPNLGEEMGFARGFEVYRHLREVDDFALVDTLLGELDGLGDQRPVFAYLHLLDVHWPYDEILADLPLDTFGPIRPEERLHEDRAEVRKSRRRGFRGADAASVGARYDHGVAWTDHALGRLVDRLRASGRWERALFVVTSDHGEGLLERGQLEHTYAPYEEVTAIPLIVRAPPGSGVVPGDRRSVVSLVDVGPTLVELAGLPAWGEVSGRSFAGVLAGREDDGRAALIETERARAVRTATGKLILPRGGAPEFYDLATDPGERHNLAEAACAGPCREHLARLRRIDAELRPPALAEGAGARPAPEDVEDLRALGYL